MTAYIYNKRFVIILFLILSFTVACTERIHITTDDAPPHLVIYGYITTDTTSHYVRLTRSGSYFATTAPEGIPGATVIIRTEGEEYILNENPAEPGLYLTDPDVYGVEGKTYTLYLAVDFEGDGQVEEYTATAKLPYAAEIDTVKVQPSDIFDDRLDILFTGSISEQNDENYFSFHAYRNGYAMHDSLSNYSIVDDQYIDKKYLEDVQCIRLKQDEDNTKLENKDIVTLEVRSITKEYFDFIWNAQSELYGSNPIFSGPPANVQTNIQRIRADNKTPLAGFFTAYSFRRKSTVYNE